MAYVPILKGRPGEFKALQNADTRVLDDLRPILEVLPNPQHKPSAVMDLFDTNAKRCLSPGRAVAVDWSALHASDPLGGWHEDHGLQWLGDRFKKRRTALRPMIRLSDPPGVLTQARNVAHGHQQGVCLRLRYPHDFHGTGPGLTARIQRLLDLMEVAHSTVDLVIDAHAVTDQIDVDRSTAVLLPIVSWSRRAPWRQRALVSGAFPPTIRSFRIDHATAVPRWDSALWQRLTSGDEFPDLDYGDYGVTHPENHDGGRTHDLSLRYTCAEHWQVYVWRKRIDGSNDDFIRLARNLVESDHWPQTGSETSWGDDQIYQCSRHELNSAGNATTWRAWATSHHLATITDQSHRAAA